MYCMIIKATSCVQHTVSSGVTRSICPGALNALSSSHESAAAHMHFSFLSVWNPSRKSRDELCKCLVMAADMQSEGALCWSLLATALLIEWHSFYLWNLQNTSVQKSFTCFPLLLPWPDWQAASRSAAFSMRTFMHVKQRSSYCNQTNNSSCQDVGVRCDRTGLEC